MEEKKQEEGAEQAPEAPFLVVRGEGRVIRKDGTVVPFSFEEEIHGFDVSNRPA